MKTYHLSDKIKQDNREILVSDLVKIKGEIFRFIKRGYYFDDEVLALVGIKKQIRDTKIQQIFIEREKEEIQEYKKETESLGKILKSLHTLDTTTDEDSTTNQENEVECCGNEE